MTATGLSAQRLAGELLAAEEQTAGRVCPASQEELG